VAVAEHFFRTLIKQDNAVMLVDGNDGVIGQIEDTG
jgi:peptide subunit release factor RF-3